MSHATVHRIIFVLFVLALGSSCSIYKSVGRSQFESKAPSQLITTDVETRSRVNQKENQPNCWLQNKSEISSLLSSLKETEKLTIENTNQDEFLICLESQELL